MNAPSSPRARGLRPTRAVGRRHRTCAVAPLAALLLAVVPVRSPADTDALSRIPLPPGASSRTVSIDLLQNGMRTSIATLEPAGSMDDALDFYRSAWADDVDGHPGFVENEAGGWTIVSRLDGDENLVVQLREGPDGVEGFLSALAVEEGERPAGTTRLPDGGERLSTTSSSDDGTSADTTIVSAPARTGELAAFYRDELRRDGWELVSERDLDGPRVVLMQRPDERLELVVVDGEGGGSVAILNRVRER